MDGHPALPSPRAGEGRQNPAYRSGSRVGARGGSPPRAPSLFLRAPGFGLQAPVEPAKRPPTGDVAWFGRVMAGRRPNERSRLPGHGADLKPCSLEPEAPTRGARFPGTGLTRARAPWWARDPGERCVRRTSSRALARGGALPRDGGRGSPGRRRPRTEPGAGRLVGALQSPRGQNGIGREGRPPSSITCTGPLESARGRSARIFFSPRDTPGNPRAEGVSRPIRT